MITLIRSLVLSAIAACLILANGCAVVAFNQPRTRMGSYATPTPGTFYIGINDLGKHNYNSPLFEGNGIIYTCRGGHIDTAHVRIAADYVRYMYQLTREHLLRGDREFTFKLNIEPSQYTARLVYPAYWKTLSPEDRQAVANDISFNLAQYFSYTMVTWHEILTYNGFKSVGIFTEFPSAFSWEDNYSNIVGVKVGADALRDTRHEFDEALTIAVVNELKKLGPQSAQVSKYAAEKMKGIWYDGQVIPDIKSRNIDIGLDDGYVTPTLVPGICDPPLPALYPVPTTAVLDKYSFYMRLFIKPRVLEQDAILKAVYPNGNGTYIEPAVHFPLIMAHIRDDAVKRKYDLCPTYYSYPNQSGPK